MTKRPHVIGAVVGVSVIVGVFGLSERGPQSQGPVILSNTHTYDVVLLAFGLGLLGLAVSMAARSWWRLVAACASLLVGAVVFKVSAFGLSLDDSSVVSSIDAPMGRHTLAAYRMEIRDDRTGEFFGHPSTVFVVRESGLMDWEWRVFCTDGVEDAPQAEAIRWLNPSEAVFRFNGEMRTVAVDERTGRPRDTSLRNGVECEPTR